MSYMFINVCMCASVNICHVWGCSHRPEEGIGSSGAGITDSWSWAPWHKCRVFNQGAISPAAINVCPNFKPGFRLLLLIFLYVYLLNEYFAISIFIHLSKASLALSKLGFVPRTWQFSPVTVCYYFQCSPSYQL